MAGKKWDSLDDAAFQEYCEQLEGELLLKEALGALAEEETAGDGIHQGCLERWLGEREGRELAERQSVDYRIVAENWCSRAAEEAEIAEAWKHEALVAHWFIGLLAAGLVFRIILDLAHING